METQKPELRPRSGDVYLLRMGKTVGFWGGGGSEGALRLSQALGAQNVGVGLELYGWN